MKRRIKIGVTVMSIAVAAAVAVGAANSQDSASLAAELNAIAVQLMQQGDQRGAILKFEEALAVDPDCAEAIHNLAKILIVGGRLDVAEKLLADALKKNPDDVGCLVPLAQIYALNGKTWKCSAILNRIALSDDKTLLPGLSLLLLKQGSGKEALVAADKALQQDSSDPERWFNKGTILEADHKWHEAAKCYEKAVALKADYMPAWLNLGNMREKLGDAVGMADCYEKALGFEPGNSTAQYNLGRVLIRKADGFDRGLELLQSATKGNDVGAAEARKLLRAMIASVEGNGGAK